VGDGGQRGFQAAGASSCDFRKGDRLAEKWRSEERKTRSLVISVRFFVFFGHHDHLENDDQLYLSDEFTWMIM
jgi:hypothetical protein